MRPTARLVVPSGVRQRDRLTRSTALRTRKIRADHFVKRCVAMACFVRNRGTLGRSRRGVGDNHACYKPRPGTRMAIARMSSSKPKARFWR